MRVALLIILWLLIGLFLWSAQRHCCGDAIVTSENTSSIDNRSSDPSLRKSLMAPTDKYSPFAFGEGDDSLMADSNWSAYRDSIYRELQPDEFLHIEGFAFENEKDSGQQNLGLQRARSAGSYFNDLSTAQLKYTSKSLPGNYDERNRYMLVNISVEKEKSRIDRMDDRTVVYFKYNSTDRMEDPGVEAYLEELATVLVNTGQSIMIRSHTDSEGSDAFNMELAQKRANSVSNYLIKRGVIPNQILVIARGERDPVASNDTEEGKAQNRRIEIQFMK